MDTTISVARPSDPAGWTPLVDPPGTRGTGGRERTVFTSGDERFTAGLWTREPDTWDFERPYDEVAFILSGAATIALPDGRELPLGPGDTMVTPIGAKGTWNITEPITKLYTIYEGGPAGDGDVRIVKADADLDWVVDPPPTGDTNPPGEEVIVSRSPDGVFVTGFWRRVPETGPMVLDDFHELACLIEGEVDVTARDGLAVSAGPGDVLVTPKGTDATWSSHSFIRKFWAIHKE